MRESHILQLRNILYAPKKRVSNYTEYLLRMKDDF